ncbi:hypothetical protein KUTeg_014082 [Tegillarca granosa]|uniref:Uncharacterized protein n=1 Tax=Tegillarca granosa TaxID=220873 RepID=A0ABQ9F120_TEGGR|nr:hypothetical protein KUTeg_014082 [Tegillarca granosa]
MKTSKPPGVIKCTVVGDGGVGKTSMLMSYTTGKIQTDYQPTQFDTYSVTVHLDGADHRVSMMDTAGQETYDRLRTLSYYDTDVFIVSFSVEDKDSFDNVKTKWIPEIKQFRPDTPFLLVGTQTDLRGSDADITESCIWATQGKKLSKRLGAEGYYECSALERSGLDDIFRATVKAATQPKKKRRVWQSFKNAFKRKSLAIS